VQRTKEKRSGGCWVWWSPLTGNVLPIPLIQPIIARVLSSLPRSSSDRNGELIPLSEKDCQLMAYFMSHPHQLLTRAQIQDHLWSELPMSNALVAQIRLLRNKINQDSGHSLINTAYGKGYRFGS
jgi:DNA-binding response OmpR family regulator